MKTIPVKRGTFAVVDDCDYEYLSQFKWGLSSSGHVQRVTPGKRTEKRFTIHMGREILGFPKDMQADHINRNKMDNRRENLRPVPKRVNIINRDLPSNSTTGYKGVWWHKRSKKYAASITSNYVVYALGYFHDPKEAYEAYKAAAKKLHDGFNPCCV